MISFLSFSQHFLQRNIAPGMSLWFIGKQSSIDFITMWQSCPIHCQVTSALSSLLDSNNASTSINSSSSSLDVSSVRLTTTFCGNSSVVVRPGEWWYTAFALRGLTALDLTASDFTALDLTASDLTALDLTALDFSALDFTALDLTASDFTSLDLTALDLSDLDLTASDFTSLDLTALDLSDLDLTALDSKYLRLFFTTSTHIFE